MKHLKWVALGIIALIIIVFIIQGSQRETHIGRTDHQFITLTPEEAY